MKPVPFTEGRMCKGGNNPSNESAERPPAPGGSGGCCERVLMCWPCGMAVVVGDGIDGRITGISIREQSRVTYEVSWWNGRCHEAKWLEPFEITPVGELAKQRIGFNG